MPELQDRLLNQEALLSLEQTQLELANTFGTCVGSIADDPRDSNMVEQSRRAHDIFRLMDWATRMQCQLWIPRSSRSFERVQALQDENDSLRARVEALEKKHEWRPWRKNENR